MAFALMCHPERHFRIIFLLVCILCNLIKYRFFDDTVLQELVVYPYLRASNRPVQYRDIAKPNNYISDFMNNLDLFLFARSYFSANAVKEEEDIRHFILARTRQHEIDMRTKMNACCLMIRRPH